MKILVVGGGGREHALTWKLARESCGPEVFCAPGNAGTARIAANVDVGAEDVDGLFDWAVKNRPDLTVVGPEAPLCAGIVDRFTTEGFRVFGPSGAAAQLEGSKVLAKDVMQSAGVPTAQARTFTDPDEAMAYVRTLTPPVVVKADGLAAGKGVTVCAGVADAERAVEEAMVSRVFGDAGTQLLVEECLEGEEASILALVDGEHIVMLASSQDHKRAYDGDEGPNTGGMGAYSPAPVVTDELWPVIRTEVFDRTLRELRKRNIVYKGILYAGVMVGPDGVPRVLEFNCRFGDPETQAILPRIDGDILPALESCVDGNLTDEMVRWRPEACVCVVMASGGYPGAYEKGKVIEGLDEADGEDVTVFHAGTAIQDGKTVTAGGRVLGVTALGPTLATAVDRAHDAVKKISFDQAHFRTDIGARALAREKA
jgi:phosphoribosylamine--glycine ligase